MLRVLMDRQHARTGRLCKQTDGSLRKNQKERLEIKHTVIEMKNAFDRLTST